MGTNKLQSILLMELIDKTNKLVYKLIDKVPEMPDSGFVQGIFCYIIGA